MPILEVLQVRLKDGISAQDPSLLENLSTVRSKIKTSSRFYVCIEDPRIIFILGQWSSLDAHKAFLASPERDEILAAQDHQLEFKWMAHIEFGGMHDLPLDSPVLGISRYFFPGRDGQEVSGSVSRLERALNRRSEQSNILGGWRCDSELKKLEYFEFAGWESSKSQGNFQDKELADEIDHLRTISCESVEMYHVVDMEST